MWISFAICTLIHSAHLHVKRKLLLLGSYDRYSKFAKYSPICTTIAEWFVAHYLHSLRAIEITKRRTERETYARAKRVRLAPLHFIFSQVFGMCVCFFFAFVVLSFLVFFFSFAFLAPDPGILACDVPPLLYIFINTWKSHLMVGTGNFFKRKLFHFHSLSP